ncbi:predicted protein [Nematostella vectensis]|uniref:Retrotransposon gag domain-containing protein n=1 Tax=Nematostella vectensis TaxID=45351 RepID=A7T3N7_NEMVE|nr:predicted protein [Nematostella vectensis]|eukprot:XP_001621528.1 hypothetical protein NEMVEDRAFT_v1g221886 [Nematostella vectensis]
MQLPLSIACEHSTKFILPSLLAEKWGWAIAKRLASSTRIAARNEKKQSADNQSKWLGQGDRRLRQLHRAARERIFGNKMYLLWPDHFIWIFVKPEGLTNVEKLAATVAALQARIHELTAQNAPTPDSSASTSSSASTLGGPVHVLKVDFPRERKVRKYDGTKDDKVLEDWAEDAQRAVDAMKLEGRDAADFLFGSLDGAARDEVRLRSRDEWETPEQLFAVLRETFGEKLTATQLLQRFYGRRQRERESIQDFSHSLMDKIQKCHPGTIANPDRDRTLRDTFVENLRDQQLRRDLKRMIRESPDRRFQAVREEALRSAEEDRPPPRTAYSREVESESECQQVTAPQSKLIQELLASQKVLTEGLQRQQHRDNSHSSGKDWWGTVRGLVDTGSMVTLVTETFFRDQLQSALGDVQENRTRNSFGHGLFEPLYTVLPVSY